MSLFKKIKDWLSEEPESKSEEKEIWWILSYRHYLDASEVSPGVPSIRYEAASNKRKFINTFHYGCTLTKEQVLWCLNNGIKIKGRFE